MVPGIQLIAAKGDCFNHITAFCDLALKPQLFLNRGRSRLIKQEKRTHAHNPLIFLLRNLFQRLYTEGRSPRKGFCQAKLGDGKYLNMLLMLGH